MNQEDIQKVEDFLKTKKAAKTIQNSFDKMKDFDRIVNFIDE